MTFERACTTTTSKRISFTLFFYSSHPTPKNKIAQSDHYSGRKMKISTMSTPNRCLLKMTTTAMTSFLWMFLLTSSMTLEGTGAQWERTLRPPPPPSSQSNQLNPTWPAVKPTADTDGQGGDPFSGWPWWWWIPAAAVAAIVVFTNCILCVWCCCCKRRRRNTDQNPEEQDDVEINTSPTNFRRMESSAAKRYLHNIASVFSWGSDFDGDQTTQSHRPSNVIYANTGQRGTVMYANPQTLGIPNPGGPPRRKSSQHYRNID